MPGYDNFEFEIVHNDSDSKARLGRLTTPHGTIETPNYIFCGTKASIKNLSPVQVKEARADIILGNTYHLLIQPGADLIEKMGGLHKFTGWDGPMLTDSGGFQIFSMGQGTEANELKGRSQKSRKASLLEITEEGARFRSYMNGDEIFLTPEGCMDIQRKIGADLIMPLDECTAYHVGRDYTAGSMERSHRWEDRCLAQFERHDDGRQALYGIVQGGIFEDLRRASSEYVNSRDFFGTAIGGTFGGEENEFLDIVSWCMDTLRPDRPVHVLGVGMFNDVFNLVRLGVDTMDCVHPTRLARHGMALMKGVPGERINLKNAKFREDPEPLDPDSDLPAARNFSKAYIHHLFKAGELLGIQILTQHNISVITRLMREVREAIRTGTLDALEKEWLAN